MLPIPPGTHWRDAKPIVLPGEGGDQRSEVSDQKKQIAGPRSRTKETSAELAPATSKAAIAQGGLRFASPKPDVSALKHPLPEQSQRERKKKVKNDPRLVAAARELRDRWLERVHADPSVLTSSGKYDVSRALTERSAASKNLAALPTRPALPAPLAPLAA